MRTPILRHTSLFLVLLLLTTALWAKPHTPKPGSKERQEIFDSLRKVVGKNHRKRIIFVVDHLKVEQGWAYYGGRFQYADGTFPGDEYMGGNTTALLRKTGRTWKVLRWVHNGDVQEPEFRSAFPRAPRAIFNRNYR